MPRQQSNSDELRRRCETKLRIHFRSNKEQNGWFEHNGVRLRRITIPLGRKPLKIGTFRNMARRLIVSPQQLDGVTDCPFGYDEYLAELTAQRIIRPARNPGRYHSQVILLRTIAGPSAHGLHMTPL